MTLPPFDEHPPRSPTAAPDRPPRVSVEPAPGRHPQPAAAAARAATVGSIAAAATTGAVLGFGVRTGVPSRAFNVIGATVLGDRARGVWGWDDRVTPTGVILLVAVMFAWGVLLARIAGGWRGWRQVAAAVAVASVAWLGSAAFVLPRLSSDGARVFGPAQLLGLHIVLAIALAVGMRFAFTGVARDPESRGTPGNL